MKGVPTDFWGKLRRSENLDALEWHPLEDHCADVAACAEALLRVPLINRRLASLGGVPSLTPSMVARLSALAALHDLGKFNLGFQRKADPRARDTAGHVAEAVTALFLDEVVSRELSRGLALDELLGWATNPATVERLLVASIAHHGRPPNLNERVGTRALWLGQGPRRPMDGIARLGARIREWFPLAFASGADPLPERAEFQHAFSGLITLADWLGSDVRFFPYREESDPLDRLIFARARAAEALRHIGLDPSGARGALGRALRFEELFPFAPRGAQRVIADLPVPTGGSVTVLEAETGSGKTEAALFRFQAMFAAGEVDGMYFALPTRTAATQIHARVVKAVEAMFPEPVRPPVVLAVPGYLRVDAVDGVPLPGFEVLWNDDERERWRFRGWAAENPKRYLAGAVVVGTIDQVLLSSLKASHAHLRATSLLRHLLVVDEVHASDVYMTRLLIDVLGRHRAAGGHALLMSATLGGDARCRLLANGTRPQVPTLEEACAVPYPAVTHVVGSAAPNVTSAEAPGLPKRVLVVRRPWIDSPEEIARRALETAAAGARVIVLRNTVRDCIATQQALEEIAAGRDRMDLLFRCAGRIAPHHARFAKEDREALDRALEEQFGQKSTGGRIVVATQTIQQSLDLDGDLLLTDLCPMDVLLQRIGRLHRHRRPRPKGFEKACVEVLTPAERDLSRFIQTDGEARGGHGIGTVYDDLRVLEATWRLLESFPDLDIPAQNRELVERATHPAALGELVRAGGAKWEAHQGKVFGKTFAHRGQAGLACIAWDMPFGDQPFGVGEVDVTAKTRLGEGDRIALLEERVRGPFGVGVHAITIPAFLARDIPSDAKTVIGERSTEGFEFSLGQTRFVYDRLGLRPLREDDASGGGD